MNAADYYELLFQMANLYNSTFEFWVTATFGFLVAIHFLGGNLTKNVRNLLISLYAAASGILIYRFLVAIVGSDRVLDAIEMARVARPPWLADSYLESLVWVVGITLLMVSGSIGSILYAIRSRARDSNSEANT